MLTYRMIAYVQQLMLYHCRNMPTAYARLERIEGYLLQRFRGWKRWQRQRQNRNGILIQAPFPWFGGKSKVASIVWQRFGDVRNFVEPFFGSGAVLLGRPTPFTGPETINDKDGYVANLWRSIQADPEAVANYADNPVNENDLHAGACVAGGGLQAGFVAKLERRPGILWPW